jgi:hypothetical protein
VVPLLEATKRSKGIKVLWLQRDLLERAVWLAVVTDRRALVKDLVAAAGRWLKELAANEKLGGGRQADR